MGTPVWNVLFVMQGKELSVKDKIENMLRDEHRDGIKDILLPLVPTDDDVTKKKNAPMVPIYPGYIFLQIDKRDGLFSAILSLDYVIKFLGASPETPSVVREHEIKLVKNVSTGSMKSNIHRYKIDDIVEITGGHCKKLSGRISGIDESSESFNIEIQLFGRSITTRVKVEDVKKA